MKTLYNYLLEAKIDTEYERNYSDIPRDRFNAAIKLDPKTIVIDGEPQGIGFVAKNLILPELKTGGDSINNIELTDDQIREILKQYYSGLARYPKPNQFETFADLIAFMQNPEAQANVQKPAEEPKEEKVDPITDIYNKYWTKIPREAFDRIIALDPSTTDSRIGEIARNLFLPKYSAGETWILDSKASTDKAEAAAQRFVDDLASYEREKQNLSNYESIKDFVEYKPHSRIAAEVPELREGEDYIYVASTPEFDVFRPLTFKGSRDLAHTGGAQNVWCTAGGSTGDRYLDRDGISSYWKIYTGSDRNTYIYEFINKKAVQDRRNNFNLAIKKGDSSVYEFRDGDNNQEHDSTKYFISFLIKNPSLAQQLKASGDPIANCPELERALTIISTANKPLVIRSEAEAYKTMEWDTELTQTIKRVEIYNVEEVLPQMFSGWPSLSEVIISGPKVIGFEAFKSCKNLTKVKLEAPLEIIEGQAFANTGLAGSIWLPNTLRKVEEKAFYNTHCNLKVDKDRTTKLSFSSKDRDWVNSHVKGINVQQSGERN